MNNFMRSISVLLLLPFIALGLVFSIVKLSFEVGCEFGQRFYDWMGDE